MKVAFLVQNNYVLHMTIPAARYVWNTPYDLIDRSSFKEFNVTDCDVNWDDYDVIIPFGSVQFIRNMRGTPIEKHMFFREESFHTDKWIRAFRDEALNSEGVKLDVECINLLFKTYVDNTYHIRPNSEDKAFIANVFTAESWREIVEQRELSEDLQCFISPVSDIMEEYRCWIVGGKVIEVSRYRANGEMAIDHIEADTETWREAQRLADIHLPEQCIVMDIASTANGYKFVEFNSIHSSGWYAGNVKTIFDSLVQWMSENA
jgi:hypothetical protein